MLDLYNQLINKDWIVKSTNILDKTTTKIVTYKRHALICHPSWPS